MDVFLNKGASASAKANNPKTTSTPLLEVQNPAPIPEPEPESDPEIVAFMASLTANERIAHRIAVEKLGTSYDIRRTHGFVNWSKRK